MGKRGPKPKPTAMKRLAGNPGKRPLPENEPQYELAVPACPSHLDAVAKAEWKRLAKELHAAGVLTRVDRAVMAGYCDSWSKYVQASLAVREHGTVLVSPKTGQPYASAYANVLSMFLKHMKMFAGELGFSPASRAGVTAIPPATAERKDKGRFLKVVG